MATETGRGHGGYRGASADYRERLETLGLSSYESLVLVALLQCGAANTLELARAAAIQRTSVYPVLAGLEARGLALRVPGDGPAVWTTPGTDEVFARLQTSLEEQLERDRATLCEVRDELRQALANAPSPDLPAVHVVPGKGQAKRLFEQLLGQARNEVLMFTRPPYSWEPGRPNLAVDDLLARSVPTRVLYAAGQLEGDEAELFRAEVEHYHSLGVVARVVDELPMKLVVVDRAASLMALTAGHQEGGPYPTNLLIEDVGCAQVHANAFEYIWATAVPYGEKQRQARRRRSTPQAAVDTVSSTRECVS